jgi:hypothetical protein
MGTNQMTTLPTEPIGMLPDGTLSIVKANDPRFCQRIVDEEGNLVELGEEKSEIERPNI